jgi:RNA polymerase sigma factor (sigma-70 family)
MVEELVRTRYGALVGFATMLTGDSVEAEDVVQDALVVVFGRRVSFPTRSHAESYVRRTIASRFVDSRRGRQRQRLREIRADREAIAQPPAPDAQVDDRLDVETALAGLAPRVRACVALRYLADQSIAETAHALGLSVGTVKRYVSDGIAALNQALGTSEPTEVGNGERAEIVSKGGAR